MSSSLKCLDNPESVIFRRTAPSKSHLVDTNYGHEIQFLTMNLVHAVRFRADWLGWVIDSVTDQNTKEVTHTVVSDEMCRTDPIYRTKVKEYCIRTHQETAETEDSEPTVSGENGEPL